ncbi:MAG TPA: hypothetical protein VF625_12755 [Longimicrobium sp.]|jgi:hypothetical protein
MNHGSARRRPAALAPGAVLAAALALVGWSAASCSGRAPEPAVATAPCAPVTGELAAGARADSLAGEFRLTLVAASGPAAGRSVQGGLRLRPFGATRPTVPASPGVSYPLFGSTDVALATVGAIAPGDVTRADPAAPGVLAMQWRRPDAPAGRGEITLRMGADANQGDALRFDGTRMALFLTSISPTRFAGRWESGGGEQRAGGYFCADRVAARG